MMMMIIRAWQWLLCSHRTISTISYDPWTTSAAGNQQEVLSITLLTQLPTLNCHKIVCGQFHVLKISFVITIKGWQLLWSFSFWFRTKHIKMFWGLNHCLNWGSRAVELVKYVWRIDDNIYELFILSRR